MFRTKTFKGRNLSEVGFDMERFLNTQVNIKVISTSLSSFSHMGGEFHSAFVLYSQG